MKDIKELVTSITQKTNDGKYTQRMIKIFENQLSDYDTAVILEWLKNIDEKL